MKDLDNLSRDQLARLEGCAAALAAALDAWLFRTHGIASSSHNVGTFLEELDASGLSVVEMTDFIVFATHRRLEDGTCQCGWNELGRSYITHVDDMMRAAAAARQ